MNDLTNIVQPLDDPNVLLKRITKTTEDKKKEQKRGFLGMLLGILVASLLGNMLTEKVILRAGYGTKKVKGVVRARYGSKNV